MGALGRFLDDHWQSYPPRHRDRVNLAIHLVGVPVFIAGMITALTALLTWHPGWLAAGLVAAALSMAAQGVGHRREQIPPERFTGALDVVRRIFTEQFVTFWRYAASGQLTRTLRRKQGVGAR